jgi:putative Ca2+/H+ antiporter (TMEM165/GDT1 family)
MDVLLPVFIAVLLAETGGRVQARAHSLQLRFDAGGAIIGALTFTTFASLLFAGIGGAIVAGIINFQARTLMAGLALLFAGGPMLLRGKAMRDVNGNSAFLTSLKGFAPLQFGDASQFIVFAMAARTGLAGLGVGAGIAATLAAAAIPVMMGRDWPGSLPLAALRRAAAILLAGAGCWMIVSALRLI